MKMNFQHHRESLNTNNTVKFSAIILSVFAISLAASLWIDFGMDWGNEAAVALNESGRIYHVSKSGNDNNPGTESEPFLTISKGAEIANPGDTVLVHAGIYRERVSPARSGTADQRITYAAAPGERVEIKGSEEIDSWQNVSGNVWKVTLPPEFFGSYNPYTQTISDLKLSDGSLRSLGEVFLNGAPLNEVGTSAAVSTQSNSWAASDDGLTIYANFGNTDPNAAMAEIDVRETVFAPTAWNLSYITVKGFIISHSANSYASSGVANIRRGAISTNAGYSWIIEDNLVTYAHTVGIDFGLVGESEVQKYGQPVNFGHNIIRNNTISYAGTTGVCAWMGAFSQIIGNAFIKNNRFNAGAYGGGGGRVLEDNVDILLKGNYFYENRGYNVFGYDWGLQGARVTGNTFINNSQFILEAGHGPTTIDNNVFIRTPILTMDASGLLFKNNLFYDSKITMNLISTRGIPYYAPHSATRIATSTAQRRFNEFYLNTFIKSGVSIPTDSGRTNNNFSNWNVFYDAAPKSRLDQNSIVSNNLTHFSFTGNELAASVSFDADSAPFIVHRASASSTLGGPYPLVNQAAPIIDMDIFNQPIDPVSPIAGPFANLKPGHNNITLFTPLQVNASAATYSYSVSPASLSFTAAKDSSLPSAQGITVTNTSNQTLDIFLSTSTPWLEISQSSINGLAPGASATVSVSVSTTSLDFQTLTDSINFSNTQNIGNKSVNVSFSVTDPDNPPPPPICPENAVSVSPSSVTVGQSSFISAPAGFSGGEFYSSNTSTATVSGSVITGASAGSVSVTGAGFTAPNGATNCSLDAASLTVEDVKTYSYTVSPGSLSFTAVKGGPLPATQSFTILNTGNQPLNISVNEAATWLNNLTAALTIDPGQNASVTFQVSNTTDSAGTRNATVTFSEPHAPNISKTVKYTITNPPTCPSGTVSLSPSSITVGQTSTASAPAGFSGGTFSSANTSVAAVSGSTLSGKAAGTSKITGAGFTAANGATGCKLAAATLTVKAIPKTYSYTVSPGSLSFTAVKGGPLPATQSFTIVNTGNQPLNISVTEGTAWLNELTPSLSIPVGQSSQAVFQVTRTSDPTGTYKATVSFSESHTTKVSKTINLTVTK